MQIEVTEKEALEIYSHRYWKGKGIIKYLPLVTVVTAIIVCLFVYSTDRQWLSLLILITIGSPGIYISLKTIRASGKYARSRIEELK